MKSKWLGMVLLPLLMVGCAKSTDVNSEGNAVGQLVWPNPDSVTLDNHRGLMMDIERVALLRNGATRDDIYNLIGRPHFNEGFRVNEWDYLFYFFKEDGTKLTCEFKILFDKNKFARNFYWKTISPAGEHCPPVQSRVINADVLFQFNGSSDEDMLPKGKQELGQFAAQIKDSAGVKAIHVKGYTDRLGKPAYNSSLSMARAQTVKAFLVNSGMDASMITAEGFGDADPIVQCDGHLPHQQLVQCLQPNRRVVLEVER